MKELVANFSQIKFYKIFYTIKKKSLFLNVSHLDLQELEDLNKWGLNIFNVAGYSHNRPLTCIMYAIFQVRQMEQTPIILEQSSLYFILRVTFMTTFSLVWTSTYSYLNPFSYIGKRPSEDV